MITNEGRTRIKRYLGGQVPSIAQSIAFGLGSTGTSATDTKLRFEVENAPLELTAYNFVEDCIIYKASIPSRFQGIITEVGLVSGSNTSNSRIITSFDQSLEFWTGQTGYKSENARIGLDSIQLVAGAGSTTQAQTSNLNIDMSMVSGNDDYKFALWNSNTNASKIYVRMLTDDSNYYEFNLGSLPAGYQIVSKPKSSATATGSPAWNKIVSIQVGVVGSGGSAEVHFDGLRIEDNNTYFDSTILVAREVLEVPYIKNNNSIQDVEFKLRVNIP